MAEQALKEMADQLTCPICLEVYKDPKLLQCFHAFCKECLEKLLLRDQQRLSLTCPSCRTSTFLPPNGVSGLPPAFFSDHLRDPQVKVKKVKGPQKTQCEKCQNADATSFCGQFLCSGVVPSRGSRFAVTAYDAYAMYQLFWAQFSGNLHFSTMLKYMDPF